MAAPNRSDVVKRVVVNLADFVRVSEAELEDRRRRFLPRIIAAMPGEDKGNWGVLLKTDKNPPSIPSDILVWLPTMEHVDVMTADDAPGGTFVIIPMWKNHGVIGKAPGTENKVGKWIWHNVKDANIPPLEPPEPPPPPPPPDEPETPTGETDFERLLVEGIDRMADGIEGIRMVLDAIATRVARL